MMASCWSFGPKSDIKGSCWAERLVSVIRGVAIVWAWTPTRQPDWSPALLMLVGAVPWFGAGKMKKGGLMLFAAGHDFAGIFMAIDDVNPPSEGSAMYVVA